MDYKEKLLRDEIEAQLLIIKFYYIVSPGIYGEKEIERVITDVERILYQASPYEFRNKAIQLKNRTAKKIIESNLIEKQVQLFEK